MWFANSQLKTGSEFQGNREQSEIGFAFEVCFEEVCFEVDEQMPGSMCLQEIVC